MSRQNVARWFAAAALGAAMPLAASTYFPISLDELRSRSDVVAVVRTVSSEVVPTDIPYTETRTRCVVKAVAQGSAPTELEVAIPGGALSDGRGSYFWMPELTIDREYVLFLRCRTDGRFSLTENALGLFEIDATGTAARRAAFSSGPLSEVVSLDALLGRTSSSSREAEALTAGPAPEPQWVNFNPEPPAVALARWTGGANVDVGFVDDDLIDAPLGAKGVPGGGVPQIQASIDLLVNDPASNINYHFVGERSATLTIHLDNTSKFGNEGFGCENGIHGELGFAGIAWNDDHSFKGSTYNTLNSASIWMRRWDCTTAPFIQSAFENSMTHELGHTLGLGHPDDGKSPHDFGPDDWDPTPTDPGAVMLKTLDYDRPTGLNADDLAGLCYLYGSCDPTGPPPGGRAAAAISSIGLRTVRGRK